MRTLIAVAALFVFAAAANAQITPPDPCPPMPAGHLCIPRQVAVKALEDADARAALEKQVKADEAAIAGYKDELEKMRIEFARVSGENTALKQNSVSDRAIIELLLKNTRKKCMPFSIICL